MVGVRKVGVRKVGVRKVGRARKVGEVGKGEVPSSNLRED
jgi:hypothetical protein